jgi:hypothetical protein
MHLSRPAASSGFGIRTHFKHRFGDLSAAVKFALLRATKPESDARELGSLHFAYWVLLSPRQRARLTQDERRWPRLRGSAELLFFSDFSGDWEVYLAGFNAALLMVLDLVWGNALGWKKNMQLHEYLSFIEAHELNAQPYFQAYGAEATVYDVRCSVDVSDRLDQFVGVLLGDAQHGGRGAAQLAQTYTNLVTEVGGRL